MADTKTVGISGAVVVAAVAVIGAGAYVSKPAGGLIPLSASSEDATIVAIASTIYKIEPVPCIKTEVDYRGTRGKEFAFQCHGATLAAKDQVNIKAWAGARGQVVNSIPRADGDGYVYDRVVTEGDDPEPNTFVITPPPDPVEEELESIEK